MQNLGEVTTMATAGTIKFSMWSDEDIERLAQQIMDRLRDRRHTKHPHIGLIGPDRRKNTDLICTLARNPTFETEEEELLSDEPLEEKAYWTSQRIIPHVIGFENLKLAKTNSERAVEIKYTFVIRTAPPTVRSAEGLMEVEEKNQFKNVTLSLYLINEKQVRVLLDIADGEGSSLLHEQQIYDLKSNGSLTLEIPLSAFQTSIPHLSTEKIPFRIGAGLLIDGKEKRLEYASYPNSPSYVYVHCFRIRLEKHDSVILKLGSVLENIGGWIAQRNDLSRPAIHPDGGIYNPKHIIYDASEETWSVGHLLECKAEIRLRGYRHQISWKHEIDNREFAGLIGIYPINALVSKLNDDSVVLEDSVIAEEIVYGVAKSAHVVSDSVNSLIAKYSQPLGLKNCEMLAEALVKALQELEAGRLERLYTFQESSCDSVLKGLTTGYKRCIAITARAAGGKTLAFLLPVAIYSAASKLLDPRPGVKAMLFYPTKALCHDQADVIIKLVWHLNKHLSSDEPLLAVGILHGDTYDRKEEAREAGFGEVIERDLRFKCPKCTRRLKLRLSVTGQAGIVQEEVYCSDPECELGLYGSLKSRQFLNKMVRATKDSIYSKPPDILLTTPDMLNVRMFYDPSEQTIFGREVTVCGSCGWRTTNPAKRVCSDCNADLRSVGVQLKPGYPRVLVFDEAHQLRGSFGAQVSYVVSRLEVLVKTLNHLDTYRPFYILSSATFSEPKRFATRFLGLKEDEVEVISAVLADQERPDFRKVHLFILPKGYSPQATGSKIVEHAFRYAVENKNGMPPHVLVFVNRIAEANELIVEAKNRLLSPEIADHLIQQPSVDGHSTDYHRRRADVEDRFSRGEVHTLIATRGLEVGVDFDIIDGLVIFGAPFYLSDYVQRTGRAGRSRSALVVTAFSDKPADFDLHRNYRVITDMQLREIALRTEQMPLETDNPVVRTRSITRALLDYLCIKRDAYKFFDEPTSAQAIPAKLVLFQHLFVPSVVDTFKEYFEGRESTISWSTGSLNPELKAYVSSALRKELGSNDLNILLESARFIADIVSRSRGLSLKDVIRQELSDAYLLWEIRQSDRTVDVDFRDLYGLVRDEEASRHRELGFIVFHGQKGQGLSYRGCTHIVTSIEPDMRESAIIKEELKKEVD
jgi:DEAD/DEAH box helicase domain-containing protein